ncbi:hypothetical protein CE91St9_24480 [Bacteroides thetaiotaomicron]|nr:hypothetical protein CE91St8_20430 [Bacteroides thetaiotaomicron]GKH67775.1 hypothetical protein CE91St9_24480 [Bacteroides thetaiotaomicron]
MAENASLISLGHSLYDLIHLSYFPEITTFNVIPLFPTNKKMLKNAKARACESLGFRILLFASVRLNLPEILVIQPYQ